MSKIVKKYICSECGASYPKWQGKCDSCNNWNTIHEEVIVRDAKNLNLYGDKDRLSSSPKFLYDIQSGSAVRIHLHNQEMNRVLGGGIVPGSLILVGGQPGIGKSTLMLQLALSSHITTLYVSGEESDEQIKMRADRLQHKDAKCFILTETNTTNIIKQALELRPQVIVIDSIQTLQSNLIDSGPGSVSQVRECATELQQFAKTYNVSIFIIGHITKEGSIAGPKVLEHIVDVVLQFEGDQHYSYRILRTLKNRFGSTDELGIFEMTSTGLREVHNPSEILISQNEDQLSGIAIGASMEGQRPLLIETQALVSNAVYGTPQRSATGFDLRRLSMLLAVLEKRGGIAFGIKDVFLNITGGIRVDDPAIDMSIIAALISSYNDISIPELTCFAGEVGLSGEIRAISRVEQRIMEAQRLGFRQIFISKYNAKSFDQKHFDIRVLSMGRIDELLEMLFA